MFFENLKLIIIIYTEAVKIVLKYTFIILSKKAFYCLEGATLWKVKIVTIPSFVLFTLKINT